MKRAVAARFLTFTEPLEGLVDYMYVDVKGLVTIGFGNLIDPIETALPLPFVKKAGGTSATRAEIMAEWNLIKDRSNALQLRTKGHRACEPLTKLMLTRETINQLCAERLQQNEANLKKVAAFAQFDQWPADAQLALHSMAWAMGSAFAHRGHWPGFRKTCGQMDFDAAAENCKMSEVGNRGLIPRNRANAQLFRNAAAVLAGESGFYNRDTLYFPMVLLKPVVLTAGADE
jgi:GH24 family phage-related lysozyme (muramidase)